MDAGKTTITEQILLVSGSIRKAGSVDSGTTQTDWLPIERSRGISVRSAAASFQRGDMLINLIDTPGHMDFAGDVERCLLALDGVILVISAVEGVQSQTEILWRALETLKLPVLIFINKIDRPGSNFDELTAGFPESLKSENAPLFFSFNRPVNESSNECAVSRETDLPEKMADAASEFDDDLMNLYILNGKLTEAQIQNSFRERVYRKEIIPVLCGSAKSGIGITELLDAVTGYMPTAAKKKNRTPVRLYI